MEPTFGTCDVYLLIYWRVKRWVTCLVMKTYKRTAVNNNNVNAIKQPQKISYSKEGLSRSAVIILFRYDCCVHALIIIKAYLIFIFYWISNYHIKSVRHQKLGKQGQRNSRGPPAVETSVINLSNIYRILTSNSKI